MGKLSKRGNLLLTDYLSRNLRKLVDEKLKPGERLPPLRKLSQKYGVSPSSMLSAIVQLERAGLVIRQHGRGVFVSDLKAPRVGLISGEFEKYVAPKALNSLLSHVVHEYGFNLRYYEAFPDHMDAVRDQVRGIITLRPPHREDMLKQLTRHGIVLVTDNTFFIPGVVTVGKNGFHAGRVAAETLIKAGHRRIGYIGMNVYFRSLGRYGVEFDSELYPAGIMEALLRHGIEPDPNLSDRMRHYPSSAPERPLGRGSDVILDSFFSLPEPPTALVLFDYQSVGRFVIRRLEERGLRVPEDISIVVLGHLEDRGPFTMVGASVLNFLEQAFRRTHLFLQSGRAEASEHVWLDVKIDDRGSIRSLL